jgi:hypothetical protein
MLTSNNKNELKLNRPTNYRKEPIITGQISLGSTKTMHRCIIDKQALKSRFNDPNPGAIPKDNPKPGSYNEFH